MFGSASLKRIAEPQTQCTKDFMNHLGAIGNKQEQIAGYGAGQFDQFCKLGFADEFCRGAFRTFGCQRQGNKTLRPQIPGGCGQVVELFAGVAGTAGSDDALDHPAAFQSGFENHELAFGEKMPPTSISSMPKRRSGLSVPKRATTSS